jgi:hypothetical protein
MSPKDSSGSLSFGDESDHAVGSHCWAEHRACWRLDSRAAITTGWGGGLPVAYAPIRFAEFPETGENS